MNAITRPLLYTGIKGCVHVAYIHYLLQLAIVNSVQPALDIIDNGSDAAFLEW